VPCTWPSWAWFIQEPVNSSFRKAAPPFADRVRIDIQLCADLFVLKPVCREQHNPSAPRQTLGRAAAPSQPLKLASLRATQFNRNRSIAHGSFSESLKYDPINFSIRTLAVNCANSSDG
jgi:hypothetical protein